MIREYVLKKQKKDKTFTLKRFSERMGIDTNYLFKLIDFRVPMNLKMAILIEIASDGEISAKEILEMHNKYWYVKLKPIIQENMITLKKSVVNVDWNRNR